MLKKIKIEHIIAASLIAISVLLWVYIAFSSKLSFFGYGGGDNISHFLISKYAFTHPCLFFHHWGKPVFTILSSPFAQFGLLGVYFFNITCSATTLFLTYKIAKSINLKHSYFAIVFTAFSPVFFFTTTTALTEPIFTVFLTLSLFLFIKRRYMLSAIIFSFVIFIRTESLMLLPIFALAYAYLRKWKAIPLLSFGFFFISLIGMSCYDTFMWFFKTSPYNIGESLYGSGNLFHFINEYRHIFGTPILLMIVFGFIYIFKILFFDKEKIDKERLTIYFLIFSIPLVFFIGHSWVWYKGIGNSLGLIRVMASIIPLCAVIGVMGLNFITDSNLKPDKKIHNYFLSGLLIWVVYFTLSLYPNIIQKPNPDEELLIEASEFVKNSSELDNSTIYYFNPIIPFLMERDLFAKENIINLLENKVNNFNEIDEGSIIIWDAHFGPNEGQVPLDTLLNNSSIELIMSFYPKIPFNVLGDHNYEIHIFKKLPKGKSSDNHYIKNNYWSMIMSKYESEVYYEKNYTMSDTANYGNKINNNNFSSNNASLYIDYDTEFFSFIEEKYNLLYQTDLEYIYFECNLLIEDKLNQNEVLIVFTIENKNNVILYEAKPIKLENITPNEWTKIYSHTSLPKPSNNNEILKCYIWNLNKSSKFYIDDVKIQFLK